jgi:hypothetical protein
MRKKAKTLEASDQFKLSPANITYCSQLLYFGRMNEQYPEMEIVLTVEFAEFIDRGELLMLRYARTLPSLVTQVMRFSVSFLLPFTRKFIYLFSSLSSSSNSTFDFSPLIASEDKFSAAFYLQRKVTRKLRQSWRIQSPDRLCSQPAVPTVTRINAH